MFAEITLFCCCICLLIAITSALYHFSRSILLWHNCYCMGCLTIGFQFVDALLCCTCLCREYFTIRFAPIFLGELDAIICPLLLLLSLFIVDLFGVICWFGFRHVFLLHQWKVRKKCVQFLKACATIHTGKLNIKSFNFNTTKFVLHHVFFEYFGWENIGPSLYNGQKRRLFMAKREEHRLLHRQWWMSHSSSVKFRLSDCGAISQLTSGKTYTRFPFFTLMWESLLKLLPGVIFCGILILLITGLGGGRGTPLLPEFVD